MKKRNVAFEWLTTDSWETSAEMDSPEHVSPVIRRRRALPLLVLVLALLFLIVGGWHTWRISEAGIAQIEQELEVATEADRWRAERQQASPEFIVSDAHELLMPHTLRAVATADPETSLRTQLWLEQIVQDQIWLPVQLEEAESTTLASRLKTDVELIALQNDVAAIKVITRLPERGTAVRQVQFYRRAVDGWRRTEPVAALWGELRSTETNYFVIHYRRRDEEAVSAVAAQVDALYRTVMANFGLTPQDLLPARQERAGHGLPAKLAFEISVATLPGMPVWLIPPLPLRVASPAVYQAPLDLTDDQLLMQALLLPIIDHVLSRAIEKHDLALRWQQMLGGLRLWQLWDLDAPLAETRPAVVRWLYQTVDQRVAQDVITAADVEICAMFRLWMQRPLNWHIPSPCSDEMENAASLPIAMPVHLHQITPWHLDQISPHPGRIGVSEQYVAMESVALATLLDYAVQTYGYMYLPQLLAGLAKRQYETWDILLPSVYGAALDDFETGWHSYLRAEYGIELDRSTITPVPTPGQ